MARRNRNWHFDAVSEIRTGNPEEPSYFISSTVFSVPFFTPWPTACVPFFTPCPVSLAAVLVA